MIFEREHQSLAIIEFARFLSVLRNAPHGLTSIKDCALLLPDEALGIQPRRPNFADYGG
jgi:hypothetical protein